MIELINELMKCFEVALQEVSQPGIEVLPPASLEDDLAELEPSEPMQNWSMKMESHPDMNYDEVPF